MGVFGNLKILWKNRKALKEVSKAADNIKEAHMKSGYKTTEFWLTVCTNIITVVGALQGVLSAETAAIVNHRS